MSLKSYKVLLNELVSVSKTDKYLEPIDKWVAHRNDYIASHTALPHRAFSIFLFNFQNKLLFQRRSIQKKTFPLCWTNTCCSHPNMLFQESSKQKKVENIRDSLHRALDRQFKMNLKDERFYFVDKILYRAQGSKNTQFGEYQVDYIFLCKSQKNSINFEHVPSEVSETEWVQLSNLDSFVKKKQSQSCQFTPWFMKMYNNRLLQQWWKRVIKGQMYDIVSNEQSLKVRQL